MQQMFSVHTTPEEFNSATITGHFVLMFENTPAGKSRDDRKVGVFKSSGLKSVFEKLRFRDALVWTVGLTL